MPDPFFLTKKPVNGNHFNGYYYQSKHQDSRSEYRLTDGKIYVEIYYTNASGKGPLSFEQIDTIVQNMETLAFEKTE